MANNYKGNQDRPVTVSISATFPKKGARKVTPADLEKAAAAAAMAFRAQLENRSPAYEVLDLEYEVQYSYIMAYANEAL
jgi:hypothetical protein